MRFNIVSGLTQQSLIVQKLTQPSVATRAQERANFPSGVIVVDMESRVWQPA